MTRVYICGPMTGLPDFNFEAFFDAAEVLRVKGYTVVNPAENDGDTLEEAIVNVHARPLGTWEDYLRRDLKNLLDCDMIYCLPGCETSRGATLEKHVAEKLGMPCLSV